MTRLISRRTAHRGETRINYDVVLLDGLQFKNDRIVMTKGEHSYMVSGTFWGYEEQLARVLPKPDCNNNRMIALALFENVPLNRSDVPCDFSFGWQVQVVQSEDPSDWLTPWCIYEIHDGDFYLSKSYHTAEFAELEAYAGSTESLHRM